MYALRAFAVRYYEYTEGVYDHFKDILIEPDENTTPDEWKNCKAYLIGLMAEHDGQQVFRDGPFEQKTYGKIFMMNIYTPNNSDMYIPYNIGQYQTYFLYCVTCFYE